MYTVPKVSWTSLDCYWNMALVILFDQAPLHQLSESQFLTSIRIGILIYCINFDPIQAGLFW